MISESKNSKWLQGVCLAVGGWYLFLWLTAFIFVKTVEHRYHIKVKGILYPTHLLPGRFRLKNPNIEWKRGLKITSGTIDVVVRSISLSGQTIDILLEGKNLQAELEKKYPIRLASAAIQFSRSSEPVIESLQVDSPVIQIQMAEKAPKFS